MVHKRDETLWNKHARGVQKLLKPYPAERTGRTAEKPAFISAPAVAVNRPRIINTRSQKTQPFYFCLRVFFFLLVPTTLLYVAVVVFVVVTVVDVGVNTPESRDDERRRSLMRDSGTDLFSWTISQ